MNLKYNLPEINTVVDKLIFDFSDQRIFCFKGDLGAGKTTLIESICRILGSQDNLSSPTFSIVNEYDSKNGRLIHMDWYRIKSIEEVLDIGVEDYLYSGDYCFIEWHQNAEPIIPKPYVLVSLLSLDSDSREISIQIIDE